METTFKIKIPVYEFTAGSKTGFKIGFEKSVKDPRTREKVFQRYVLVVLSSNQVDIDFFRKNLVIGSVVTAYSSDLLVTEDNHGDPVIQMLYGEIIQIFPAESNYEKENNLVPVGFIQKLVGRVFDHDERQKQIIHGKAMCDE